MRCIVTALLLLWGLGGLATADEEPLREAKEPLTFEQAADAALTAFQANEEDALSRLAAQEKPDPWLVADELCFRGNHDAAAAFAEAAPRRAVEGLPAYVASLRTREPDRAARRVLAEMGNVRRGDWEAVLAVAENAQGPLASVTRIRIALARAFVLTNLRRYLESAEAFRTAADAAHRLDWLTRAAGGYEQAGLAAYRTSDWRSALAAWRSALGAFESLDDRPGVARTLGGVGLVHRFLGDYAQALDFYARALAINDALGDRAGAAQTLSNTGSVHVLLGDHDEARRLYSRALRMREALGDQAGIAATLGNLGIVHDRQGDYAAALHAQERSLASFEALGDRKGVARTLVNIGNVHEHVGEYAKAQELHRRALAIFEVLGDRAGAASALNNVGNGQQRLGDYPQALKTYELVLEMNEALDDGPGLAVTLGRLGVVYECLGLFPKALHLQTRALERSEALGDRDGVACALGNIGILQTRLGNHAKALELCGRALEILETVDAPVVRASTLSRLAEALVLRGSARDAIRFARDAAAVVSGLVTGLGEREGATARELWTAPFVVGAQAALRAQAHEDLVFFLESGRAGGLREALGARETLAAVLIPPRLRRLEAGARAREAAALARLERARERGSLSATRTARQALAMAREELETAVERIQREAKAGADVAYPQAAPLARIQGWLGAGETLLLLGPAGDDVVAVVVTSRDVRAHSLGAEADVDALAMALDLADPEEDASGALEALRVRIVERLDLGSETTCVLVSPYGALSYVPFALLFPDHAVAYVSSGTTYGLLTETREKRGDKVLALGDPDYALPFDPEVVAAVRGGRKLQPLPGTRQEVRVVGDHVLVGREATEGGLARAAATQSCWRAVHLACHGLIDVERPMFSALALTPDGHDDGYLTCLEVFRMELLADLVVLSACETAKGRVYKAEGIVGLTRAFMFAGSPRVICSLWKVDDEATRALMVKFYELWNPKEGEGVGAAVALRQAQEYVRGHERWQHPYYWAAWVLWGLPE